MRTEVIKADTIDAAAERIIDELKEDTAASTSRSIISRGNVIYFDGWDGLGASAVLQEVAQRLVVTSEAPPGLHFDQIIRIDCSKWESRRAMQRVIAEQLELPAEVMQMLDAQDEDDDYRGADHDFRAELPQVVREIYQRIQNRRLLVIFYNGSSEEIDLTNFGFAVQGLGFHLYSSNKVLWTFQGAFRLKSRMTIDWAMKSIAGTTTGVFLSAVSTDEALWSDLVRHEAAELVARKSIGRSIMEPAQVADCFLYTLNLCGMGRHFTMDYDLATHGSNYWVCDGIIRQLEGDADVDDSSWRAAEALQREMLLDMDYYPDHQYLPSHLVKCAGIVPCWSSPTYRTIQILDGGAITSRLDIFQHFNKLAVLKLSHCTFSFSSPPFICCHYLRFLWLDHCKDQEIISSDGAAGKEDIRRCFQRLWVLDVRYTCCDRILSAEMMDLMTQLREVNVMGAQDWDMGQLQRSPPNVCKFRVTKSTIHCSIQSQNDLFSGMYKMELLDFSGNRITSGMTSLSMAANSNISLETIIIDDGCVGLEMISLRGCANLKNVSLRGLFKKLVSLDISGTAVKTLDLSALEVQELDELIALGCDKLCAILWPPEGKRKKHLSKLRLETIEVRSTGVTVGTSPSSLSMKFGSQAPTMYNWYTFLSDSRLLRSLEAFKQYIDSNFIHVEISSPTRPSVDVGGSAEETRIIKRDSGNEQLEINNNASVYAGVADTLMDHMQQASQGGDGDASTITRIWPCPFAPKLEFDDCYVYVQDQPLVRSSESINNTTITVLLPDMICDGARILHVHDSKSITCAPVPAIPLVGWRWCWLRWCRVERCPSLDYVFSCPLAGNEAGGSDDLIIFNELTTLWSSQLPKARYIWNLTRPSSSILCLDGRSFGSVEFVHLDFCPRLTYVLPLSKTLIHGPCLHTLRTLEIVWCGDLRAVFPLETGDAENNHDAQELQQSTTMEFPNLNHIHLHELPMLQGICGHERIYVPNLKTIKIRGCWSLTRLPVVDSHEKVECDCEEEWWDGLKWDGMDAKHHPSLYNQTHPKYYKKILLRGSVLV